MDSFLCLASVFSWHYCQMWRDYQGWELRCHWLRSSFHIISLRLVLPEFVLLFYTHRGFFFFLKRVKPCCLHLDLRRKLLLKGTVMGKISFKTFFRLLCFVGTCKHSQCKIKKTDCVLKAFKNILFFFWTLKYCTQGLCVLVRLQTWSCSTL